MLTYIFRKPKFPIICDFEGVLVAAESEITFVRQIENIRLIPDKLYNVVDVSGEGWYFSPEYMAISPLTAKKRWSKKEIISLYNDRKNARNAGTKYSEKSLSVKRFDKIFKDIVELLLRP